MAAFFLAPIPSWEFWKLVRFANTSDMFWYKNMLDVYRWVECVWRYLQMDMTLHRKNTNGQWTASDNISKYSSDSIKCQFLTDMIDNWYQVGKVCEYDGYVPIYAHTGTSMAVFKIKLRHIRGINMDVVASQSPVKRNVLLEL